MESQRPLAAGRAKLKQKRRRHEFWNHSGPWRPGGLKNAVQTRIWNHGGPWRPDWQKLKQKRPRHEFGIKAALGGRAGKFESESGANTNLESQRPSAAGRANLKAKAVQTRIWNQGGPWRPGGQICKRKRCKHKFGITAAFGGRAGNLKRMQLIGFRVVSGGPGGRIKNTVFA